MLRGRYWGFILDGEHAGDVLEHEHNQYQYPVATYPPYEAVFASPEDVVAILPTYSTITLFHKKMQIGDRVYGVWADQVTERPEDMTRAVLALIDMDPGQARMCEITRRPL